MRLKQAIAKVFTPEVEQMGFRYMGQRGEYIFERKIDHVTERITIDKSDWNKNSLRIAFITKNNYVNGNSLIGRNPEEWFEYESEQKIPELLQLFVEITQEHGLKWLEENRFTGHKLEKNILEKHFSSTIEPFILKYGLDIEVKTSLQILDNKIAEKQFDEESVIPITFIVGEIIIRNIGGEWDYNELNEPYLKQIGGVSTFKKNIYSIVKSCLEKRSGLTLLEFFEIIDSTSKSFRK